MAKTTSGKKAVKKDKEERARHHSRLLAWKNAGHSMNYKK
jgi:hypothetical protein